MAIDVIISSERTGYARQATLGMVQRRTANLNPECGRVFGPEKLCAHGHEDSETNFAEGDARVEASTGLTACSRLEHGTDLGASIPWNFTVLTSCWLQSCWAYVS